MLGQRPGTRPHEAEKRGDAVPPKSMEISGSRWDMGEEFKSEQGKRSHQRLLEKALPALEEINEEAT